MEVWALPVAVILAALIQAVTALVVGLRMRTERRSQERGSGDRQEDAGAST